MKLRQIIIGFLFFSVLGMISCKSEFEKIRVNGTPSERLFQAYQYYDEQEYYKAQSLLESCMADYKGKKESERIYFTYSYCLYHQELFEASDYHFGQFANLFTNSIYREESDFMKAYSNYKMSPKFRLDQQFSKKAIDLFQLFTNLYPTSPRVKTCNEKIDELRRKMEKKAFYSAKLYYDMQDFEAAILSFENLLKEYPETPDVEKVRFLILESTFRWAENSILVKQKERYEKAIESYKWYSARHPNGENANNATTIYNETLEKLKVIG